jgi:hypothetical protein
MGDIRALIKEILAEELALLRAEFACNPAVERVSVSTSADLNRFALSVLDRANDPGFVSALRNGRLHFEPVRNVGTPERVAQLPPAAMRNPAAKQPEALVTTIPPKVPELSKSLITERLQPLRMGKPGCASRRRRGLLRLLMTKPAAEASGSKGQSND